MSQVNQSILKAAMSVVDSDETRRFTLRCDAERANAWLYMKRYNSKRLDREVDYVYKNLKLFN